MANAPVRLGALDLGVAKKVVVQMLDEAGDRLRGKVEFARVISHNIHRDFATIPRSRARRKKRGERSALLDGENPAQTHRNPAEIATGARLHWRSRTNASPLSPQVNFSPNNSGCIVARLWRLQLHIC
jgi:hypothetical protein